MLLINITEWSSVVNLISWKCRFIFNSETLNHITIDTDFYQLHQQKNKFKEDGINNIIIIRLPMTKYKKTYM